MMNLYQYHPNCGVRPMCGSLQIYIGGGGKAHYVHYALFILTVNIPIGTLTAADINDTENEQHNFKRD